MNREEVFNAIDEILENDNNGVSAGVDIFQTVFKIFPPEKYQSVLCLTIEACKYVEWRRQAMNYADRAESLEKNAKMIKDFITLF